MERPECFQCHAVFPERAMSTRTLCDECWTRLAQVTQERDEWKAESRMAWEKVQGMETAQYIAARAAGEEWEPGYALQHIIDLDAKLNELDSLRTEAHLLREALEELVSALRNEKTKSRAISVRAKLLGAEQALASVPLAAKEAERVRHRASIRHVDMTPDAALPRRILEAYLDDTYWTDNTGGVEPSNPLCVEMNKWREERNAIIRAALADLESKDA